MFWIMERGVCKHSFPKTDQRCPILEAISLFCDNGLYLKEFEPSVGDLFCLVSRFVATVGSFVKRCVKRMRDKQNFKNIFNTTELFNSFWRALKTVHTCWQDESSGPTKEICFLSSWGALKTVQSCWQDEGSGPAKKICFRSSWSDKEAEYYFQNLMPLGEKNRHSVDYH